jgi:phosphoribosylaminoimidazolecarboxamide formyltransferase/IMP cyclohydrolase
MIDPTGSPSVDAAARRPVRRALISVFDKTGLIELAEGLHSHGVTLVSTGSTATTLAEAGLPVTPVEQVTGFPECLDGRVKTLHPAIHAGLLADLRRPEHQAALAQLGIEPFDLLVSNLYPFTQTVAAGGSVDECVEQIDIGGPAMVRAAAKNHPTVAVVTDPSQYDETLAAVAAGGFTAQQRARLAATAFASTASYDVAVASWMASTLAPPPPQDAGLPSWAGATWRRQTLLRYGENPHQQAALYVGHDHRPGLARAVQLHGKDMSYNNYVDADAARRAAYDHLDPAVAIVKHANPCGIAVADPGDPDPIATAYRAALACDPTSAFGGVVATNRAVSAGMAAQVAEVFTEVIIAPDYDPEALDILTRKRNLRILTVPASHLGRRLEMRTISGGVLMQTVDDLSAPGDDPAAWRLVSGEPVDPATLADLEFAWRTVRAVRSNAIVLAAGRATVGVGMGQVNRVDASRLAVSRAGAQRARGAVAASDAFFPFPDGLQVLLDAGVRAVVQPGGSVRDEEVIAAAQAAGVPMYFTGTRHFAH